MVDDPGPERSGPLDRRESAGQITRGKGGLLDLDPVPAALDDEMTRSEALADLRYDE